MPIVFLVIAVPMADTQLGVSNQPVSSTKETDKVMEDNSPGRHRKIVTTVITTNETTRTTYRESPSDVDKEAPGQEKLADGQSHYYSPPSHRQRTHHSASLDRYIDRLVSLANAVVDMEDLPQYRRIHEISELKQLASAAKTRTGIFDRNLRQSKTPISTLNLEPLHESQRIVDSLLGETKRSDEARAAGLPILLDASDAAVDGSSPDPAQNQKRLDAELQDQLKAMDPDAAANSMGLDFSEKFIDTKHPDDTARREGAEVKPGPSTEPNPDGQTDASGDFSEVKARPSIADCFFAGVDAQSTPLKPTAGADDSTNNDVIDHAQKPEVGANEDHGSPLTATAVTPPADLEAMPSPIRRPVDSMQSETVPTVSTPKDGREATTGDEATAGNTQSVQLLDKSADDTDDEIEDVIQTELWTIDAHRTHAEGLEEEASLLSLDLQTSLQPLVPFDESFSSTVAASAADTSRTGAVLRGYGMDVTHQEEPLDITDGGSVSDGNGSDFSDSSVGEFLDAQFAGKTENQ